MTVRELKLYLGTIDQEAEVQLVFGEDYEGVFTQHVEKSIGFSVVEIQGVKLARIIGETVEVI